jgi:hypothetical protein
MFLGVYLNDYEVNPPLVMHSQVESLPHQAKPIFNEPLQDDTNTIMGTFAVF